MSRTKIDYGIDLGTTNSAISRMENGETVIKKTDLLKDTMPSCVYFNKKKAILVGDTAFQQMKSDKLRSMKAFEPSASNSFIEFKRTMGTDEKYFSSNMQQNFTSEELSAEVLKTLKSFVTDETVKSVVITVPAMFTINQKDATRRAAKLAGFEHVELLQEPIAASIAYGLDSKNKDGYWLVFDFGGGTFDAALLRVEEGIMKVIDTDGDNYLGGKNLDFAIVDEIIIPYLKKNFVINNILNDSVKKEVLREAMKFYAEETKIQLSFNDTHNILSDLGDIPGTDDEGTEFELDITVTQEDLKRVLGPIFQKSIDIAKDVLKRKNIEARKLDSLILVGGPTYSPILRKMLEQQICKPDTSADPMTVVSKGAALYASTIDVSDEIKEAQRDNTKIQIELGYEATTVEQEEFVTVKVLREKTEGNIPDKILVEIVRSDKAWSSGKQQIGNKGDIIEVKLNEGKSNLFNIFAYTSNGDLLPCQPDNFSILQGTKPALATLPYHIGIEIKSRASGKIVFQTVKGLEKNQSTPAIGTKSGLKTQKQIRPGKKEDFIKIPIYQGEINAEGSRAIYNEHVYDVIISGEDLPALLPENSDVDLTIKVDKSEKMTVSAFFPTLEHTSEIIIPDDATKGVEKKWLQEEIQKTKQSLHILQQETNDTELSKLEDDLKGLEKDYENGKESQDTRKQILNNLRKVLRKLEDKETVAEWPKTEEELKDVFYRLETNCKKLSGGNIDSEKLTSLVLQFKEQIPQVIKEKNVKLAQELIDNMRSLDFAIIKEVHGVKVEISYIYSFHEDFDMIEWKSGTKQQARQLINEGLRIANDNPTVEKLKPVIVKIFGLMIDPKSVSGGDDGSHVIG